MAKWTSPQIQDGGSDVLRALAATAGRIKQHLVKAYAAGDSYATVLGNSLGGADMAAADFVQSTNGSGGRVTTVAAKSIALSASSGASPDLHVVLVDSVASTVLQANDETTNVAVFVGGTFAVPAWTYTLAQPS